MRWSPLSDGRSRQSSLRLLQQSCSRNRFDEGRSSSWVLRSRQLERVEVGFALSSGFAEKFLSSLPERTIVPFTRSLSRFIARFVVGLMVFAQVAVAAHACSGLVGTEVSDQWASAGWQSATGIDVAGAATSVSPDCNPSYDVVDSAQPNLCVAHCQFGQQNAGGNPVPDLPAALPVSPHLRVKPVLPGWLVRASMVQHDPPLVVDQPHAIQHCCFRI